MATTFTVVNLNASRKSPQAFTVNIIFIETEHFDIEKVQQEILNKAKKYTHETDEFEILTELQHFGGKTNLIDFTTDYLVALFFACDGSHDKNGRIILQKRKSIEKHINRPRNPRNRVIAQKSLFVRPPQGFLEPDDVITIPKHLKQPILEHLRKYHGLSTQTIYNDLQGFIKHQDIHQSAYTEFYKGLTCQDKGLHDNAICHYTKAIELKPNDTVAYFNRGISYYRKGEFNLAIADYEKVTELKPDYPEAYANRGEAWLHLKEWEKARSDLISARDRGVDIIAAFHNDYESVADFEQKNGVKLPTDFAAMLTRQQD